ncbi:MAG: hypothetical protein HC917_06660 [Richelia sp. SM2_1_7]|nr:hypothetical protein [Richelia sp. SM2_1_7]
MSDINRKNPTSYSHYYEPVSDINLKAYAINRTKKGECHTHWLVLQENVPVAAIPINLTTWIFFYY